MGGVFINSRVVKWVSLWKMPSKESGPTKFPTHPELWLSHQHDSSPTTCISATAQAEETCTFAEETLAIALVQSTKPSAPYRVS